MNKRGKVVKKTFDVVFSIEVEACQQNFDDAEIQELVDSWFADTDFLDAMMGQFAYEDLIYQIGGGRRPIEKEDMDQFVGEIELFYWSALKQVNQETIFRFGTDYLVSDLQEYFWPTMLKTFSANLLKIKLSSQTSDAQLPSANHLKPAVLNIAKGYFGLAAPFENLLFFVLYRDKSTDYLTSLLSAGFVDAEKSGLTPEIIYINVGPNSRSVAENLLPVVSGFLESRGISGHVEYRPWNGDNFILVNLCKNIY